jgi:HD superfamily phosphohydrolase YqeK
MESTLVKITKEGKEMNEKNQIAYMAGIIYRLCKQTSQVRTIQFIFQNLINNDSNGVAWPGLV